LHTNIHEGHLDSVGVLLEYLFSFGYAMSYSLYLHLRHTRKQTDYPLRYQRMIIYYEKANRLGLHRRQT
jgi:hypothetical protein